MMWREDVHRSNEVKMLCCCFFFLLLVSALLLVRPSVVPAEEAWDAAVGLKTPLCCLVAL